MGSGGGGRKVQEGGDIYIHIYIYIYIYIYTHTHTADLLPSIVITTATL